MPPKHWSTDTFAVRERFGIGVVLLGTSYCAGLLVALRAINASPFLMFYVFGLIGLVAVAQAVGRSLATPRAVSVAAGALYTLACSFLIALASGYAVPPPGGALVITVMFGAGAGYVAGGFVASVFLVHDWMRATWGAKRREREALSAAVGKRPPESPWDDEA